MLRSISCGPKMANFEFLMDTNSQLKGQCIPSKTESAEKCTSQRKKKSLEIIKLVGVSVMDKHPPGSPENHRLKPNVA